MPGLLGRFFFKGFLALDKIGVHLLPKHYCSPVPDYTWLLRHREAWTGRCVCPATEWHLEAQLEWLLRVCRPYYQEVAGLSFYKRSTDRDLGPGFGPIESQVLHCFVRAQVPERIIEIGSGVSTACMLNAIHYNGREGKRTSQIICIEPYPRSAFHGLKEITHIQQPCQLVDKSVFSGLKAGDLLFVDSSHSVRIGSDVLRIYLEIIPSLPAGVFIHIHDIFLPYLYPRATLSLLATSQETALLLSLLTNNMHLTTLACLSALHYDRSVQMQQILPDYQPQENSEGLPASYPPKGHFPNSMWLQTC